MARLVLAILPALLVAAAPAPSQETAPADPPLPLWDPVSNISAGEDALAQERAAVLLQYAEDFATIRHRHFGEIRDREIRATGLAELRSFSDPAAFRPMWRELRAEDDDVRLTVLDHFAAEADEGQAALAWIAIVETGEDELAQSNRYEVMRRLTGPPSSPVLALLAEALRSKHDDIANAAGTISGALDAVELVPQLIFGQSVINPSVAGDQGDLAWIAIQKQTAYVAQLIPIVNDNAVAFQPIPGILAEGTILRVNDAVVIIYRTEIHRVLVTMTSHDWGAPTDHLGYDTEAWIDWYNNEYLPFREEEARIRELAGDGRP